MSSKLAIRTVVFAIVVIVMGSLAQEAEENALRARFMRLREIIMGESLAFYSLWTKTSDNINIHYLLVFVHKNKSLAYHANRPLRMK